MDNALKRDRSDIFHACADKEKPPKAIVTKFCTGNKVGLVNLCTMFGSNRLPGDFSVWNITLLSLTGGAELQNGGGIARAGSLASKVQKGATAPVKRSGIAERP